MRYYAGVGSRVTPLDVCRKMTYVAVNLKLDGWTLRSGGAIRADLAFEEGAGAGKEIFRPEDATPEAIELSSRFHPDWSACSHDTMLKHGRNAMIVLGADLRTPVEFLACWTPGGEVVGGTGQAMRIAAAYDIPIFNFATQVWRGPEFIRPQGRLL